MFTLIDDYSPIGNSLKQINDNFSLLNIRTCLANDDYYRLDAAFTWFQTMSGQLNDFYTNIKSTSAELRTVSTLVHNTSGFWLEPINITYQNTFSSIANYREIENWLDTTFGAHTFAANQIVKVSFSVKNYDPAALNNAPLPASISTDYLNQLAATYGQNYQDVQNYLSYTNCINTIITTINNIFKLVNRTDLLITDITQRSKLVDYFNNIVVYQQTFSSSKMGNLSQDNFTLIYTILQQYMLIEPQYDALVAKGIGNIPASALANLQINNIFSLFFSSMCFHLNKTNNWKFIPDCNINFCVDQYCFDCFDYVDVNELYNANNCPLISKFKLINCEDDAVYISGNIKFHDYLHAFLDIIIDGVQKQVYVTEIDPNTNYPNSSILLSNRYTIIGLSAIQHCPYGSAFTLAEDDPMVFTQEDIDSGPSNAVVVTVHPAYVPMLDALVQSIDAQTQPFAEKIVVYDKGDYKKAKTIKLPKDWKLLKGNWKNPNAARNLGANNVKNASWITFWDADNVMPKDYNKKASDILSNVDSNVAVAYPDVQNLDKNGKKGHLHKMPDWSYETAQQKSLTDSSSYWRKAALYNVSGFSEEQNRHDDYALSLKMLRQGWQGIKLPTTINHLTHEGQRSEGDITESLWTAYTYGFVTLWSNYTYAHEKLMDWYEKADVPPHSTLYWVDNTDGKLYDWLLNQYQTRLVNKFENIVLVKDNNIKELKTYFDRHNNVARLYNNIFGKTKNENIVVTIEDDNIPPLNGVKSLLTHFVPGSNIAEVSSVYRSRTNPEHICGALNKTRWVQVPKVVDLPKSVFEVGMTGGGFALYANWALQKCLPLRCEVDAEYNNALYGWDGNLGKDFTKNGFKILLDPNVFTEHHCDTVIKYLEENNLEK